MEKKAICTSKLWSTGLGASRLSILTNGTMTALAHCAFIRRGMT
jgi:hypothetical protein